MRTHTIRDRDRIESFLRRNTGAHVYPLADLDEPFWDQTRWFCAESEGRILALALLLEGLRLPIVYAVCPEDEAATRRLLRSVEPQLPDRFFYNLAPGVADDVFGGWQLAPEGRYWKMTLADRHACDAVSDDGVEPIGCERLAELREFLARDAYRPGELGGLFFEPEMLDTGCYRCVREEGRLVAVGGVHVHSRRYGVAGIGNVVTRPDARGRGLARRVSAAVLLCGK